MRSQSINQSMISGVCSALLCLAIVNPARADVADEALYATVDLYNKMTEKDLAGFLKYRPDDGYSSFNPDNKELQILGLKPFEVLFDSGIKINLRTSDLKARTFGDAVLVTGLRIGYMAPAGVAPVERPYALTMIWSKTEGQMKLRHVHYSMMPSEK